MAALHERWEAHLVADDADRRESLAALARVPPSLADEYDAALADARSPASPPLVHFGFIPDGSATDAELATLRVVLEHSVGERWHRFAGPTGLLVRSEERSSALVQSVFTLLCQVLDGRAPPHLFGTLARIPVVGVVWFGVDAGGADPGVFAVWMPVRANVMDEYHGRCPEEEGEAGAAATTTGGGGGTGSGDGGATADGTR